MKRTLKKSSASSHSFVSPRTWDEAKAKLIYFFANFLLRSERLRRRRSNLLVCRSQFEDAASNPPLSFPPPCSVSLGMASQLMNSRLN